MKIGITGYRGSGKTTLFEALSGMFHSHDYSDKIKIHNVKVPDARVDTLSVIFKPKKTSYATIDYVDLPGFDRDRDTQKSGISQQYVQKLKEMDGFLVVLDGFSGNHGYIRDRNDFNSDILINDLIIAEQRLSSLKKANTLEGEYPVIEKIYSNLEMDIPVREMGLSHAEADLIKHYRFLSQKPSLFILNSKEDTLKNADINSGKEDENIFCLNVLLEKEITELSPEDQRQFLMELEYDEPLKNRIIYKLYNFLGLISFLTANANEVRAWPVIRGSNALKAASKVHSDIARGFIRAEVISYDEFDRFRSMPAARKAGKIRSEGRDYIIADGDIIEFRFNI